MKSSYFTYATPVGRVTIASNGESIVRLAFGSAVLDGECRATALTNEASNQLQQYFAGKRYEFDLPLFAQGTPFQQSVWDTVLQIPYGQTLSYAEVAQALGSPNSARAVGTANNRNPLPILIPCHRVIGSNGKPVGYAGGLKIKLFLLNLERTHSYNSPAIRS